MFGTGCALSITCSRGPKSTLNESDAPAIPAAKILTQFISALDERIQCAAVIEGGTANRWPIELEPGSRLGPADIEQNLFPAAIYGVDNVDVHVAIAPRPLLAASEHRSPQFDGARQAIERRYAQRWRSRAFHHGGRGRPPCLDYEVARGHHRLVLPLVLPTSGADERTGVCFAGSRDLYCCPEGSLRYASKGQTIFARIRAEQAPLPPERPVPQSPGESASYQREMQAAIGDLLRIRITDQALGPQPIVTMPRKGYKIEKVEFLSEPGCLPAGLGVCPRTETRRTRPDPVHQRRGRAGGRHGI